MVDDRICWEGTGVVPTSESPSMEFRGIPNFQKSGNFEIYVGHQRHVDRC